MPESKRQTEFTVTPEYLVQDGVKHEFTGTLFIPALGENERIEKEQAARAVSPIGYGQQLSGLIIPTKPERVKIDMKTALRLRAK